MKNLITKISRMLKEIDSATFQLLVNQYLRLEDPDIINISPNGSHAYKLKTTTGQPDAHFWLKDERMLWAEHTTTAGKADTVAKFKKDIDGCQEERDNNLGIAQEKIRELKLCYTVDLDPKQELDLKAYGKDRGFEITLLGLGTLSADLQNKHPGLAELFLSVCIGSGQLFLSKEFVKFKANLSGGIATPLDNPFIGRRQKIDELKKTCEKTPVVCVSGASGVGKSRLSLEALQELSEENNYPVFVLEDNGQDVYQDLHKWFDNLASGYLLIEDANRQLGNLKQVITFLKQQGPDKNIRVVLTVRNYAEEAVEQELLEIDCHWVQLGIVSDEEIRAIIANDPYKITKVEKQYEISNLVNGNVRFALMIARLVHDKQVEDLPKSFLELFDLYFKTYVKDFKELLTSDYIKTLGLFSLFKTFDMANGKKEERNKILIDFNIKPENFQNCIDELRRRELVTQKFDVAFLTEQVFATYFFYLAFIKDKKLNFSQAMAYDINLRNYSKLSEHLNEIGRRFGTQVVLEAVKEDLLLFEEALKTPREWDDYLKIFWQFREEKVLQRMKLRIRRSVKNEQQDFNIILDNSTVNHHPSSNELRLLGNLYQSEKTILKEALDLSFRYCNKNPNSFLTLVKLCKENILLESDELLKDTKRQRYLFQFLFDGIAAGEKLHKALFLSTAGFYLSSGSSVREFLLFEKNYDKNSSSDNDQQLRDKIWAQLYHLYPTESEAVIKTLNLLASGRHGRITKNILSIDIHWSTKIIRDYFKPEKIKDAALTSELIYALEKYKPDEKCGQLEIESIKNIFNTQSLRTLKDLGWKYWKYNRNEELTVKEQQAQHKEFVRKNYSFADLSKAKEFAQILEGIVKADLLHSHELQEGLRTVLLINLKSNTEVGRFLIDEWLRLDLRIDRGITVYLGSQENLINLYLDALSTLPEAHEKNRFWFFAQSIAPAFVTGIIRKKIIATISDIPKRSSINFIWLKQIMMEEKELLDWIASIHDQANSGKGFYYVGEEEMFDFLIEQNLSLAKSIYLQQLLTDNLFDLSLDNLLRILKVSPEFVVDYVHAEFIETNFEENTGRRRQLGLVWQEQGVLDYFAPCTELVLKSTSFHFLRKDTFEILFKETPDNFKNNVKSAVFKYLTINLKDDKKMGVIFNGIRTQLPNLYPEAVYLYLDNNNALESFSSFQWTSSGGVFSGNTNVSKWRQDNWKILLELIEAYPGKNDISEIIGWIQKKIDNYEREILDENKRMIIAYR